MSPTSSITTTVIIHSSIIHAARIVCVSACPSVCLSRQTTAAAACGWFAAERRKHLQQISNASCRRRAQQHMRAASYGERRYEAAHRLVFFVVSIDNDYYTHCSKLGDRSFSAAGPRLWNDLPPRLRRPGLTFDSFRQSLKTHLFSDRGA